MKYHVSITFEAANIEEAEDYAAHVQERAKRGRTALYYDDPISGRPVVWAEPAMSADQLAARRNHGSS